MLLLRGVPGTEDDEGTVQRWDQRRDSQTAAEASTAEAKLHADDDGGDGDHEVVNYYVYKLYYYTYISSNQIIIVINHEVSSWNVGFLHEFIDLCQFSTLDKAGN